MGYILILKIFFVIFMLSMFLVDTSSLSDETTYKPLIKISNAIHLNKNKDFIENIYDKVRILDNKWSEPIYNNEYVRVTFERSLTSDRDITIYARNNQSLNTIIEVYYYNSTEKITEFPVITEEKYYKVYLTNMSGSHDAFDLRIKNLDNNENAYLEIDHIVDPVYNIVGDSLVENDTSVTEMNELVKLTMGFTSANKGGDWYLWVNTTTTAGVRYVVDGDCNDPNDSWKIVAITQDQTVCKGTANVVDGNADCTSNSAADAGTAYWVVQACQDSSAGTPYIFYSYCTTPTDDTCSDFGDITNSITVLLNKPLFSSPTINDTDIFIGEVVNHSITITNSSDGYIFSWNASGSSCDTWVNSSWVDVDGAIATGQNISTIPVECKVKNVGWKFYANNSAGWSDSTIQTYYVYGNNPRITANVTSPIAVRPSTDWKFNMTAEDPDNATFTGYVQFYVNGTSSGPEQSQIITTDTNTLIGTLSNSNFGVGATLIAEFWAGDGSENSTKENTTEAVVYGNKKIINCSNMYNNIPIVINGSNGFTIDGEKQIVWTYCLGTEIYLYYNNYSDYVVENSETQLPTEVEFGNGTSYNPEEVWDSNFLMVQHMQENPSDSTPQAIDSTSNNNDGICNDTMSSGNMVDGKIDGALNFSGAASDSIEISNDASLDIYDAITLSAWINPYSLSGDHWIFNKYSTAARYFQFRVNYASDGLIAFMLGYNSGASFTYSYASNSLLALSQPNYLVATWDKSVDSGNLKIFLNGSEVNYDTQNTLTSSISPNDLELYIGSYGKTYAEGGWFNGMIDEARIENITRNSTYINQTYQNVIGTLGYGNLLDEPNNAPTITASVTKPDTVYTNTDWMLNLTVTDPDDGDTITSYTQFYVNDSEVGSVASYEITNNTNINVANLSSLSFGKGANLTAEFWAGDATVNTTKENTTQVTVQNSVPTDPTDITGFLANLYVTDSLTVTASGGTDADNDIITYHYKFYNVNESATRQDWSATNSYTITTSDAHDTIRVYAKSTTDAANSSGSYYEDDFVNDTTPTLAVNPAINDSNPKTDAILNCNAGSYDDEDSDAQGTSNWKWFKNNTEIGGQTSQTLDLSTAGNGDNGDNIICSEQPTNNYGTGSYYNSSSVTIIIYGTLSVSLSLPTNNTEVTQNSTFTINATINCTGSAGAKCGEVYALVRYNETLATPDTAINITAGASLFYIVGGLASEIYVGGLTTRTVKKYDANTLAYIDETANYGGDIYSVFVDDDYIYAGGLTTRIVRRYDKDTLAYIDETPNYGGNIISVFVDDDYIYAGGLTTQTVRKYDKDTLAYIDQTANYSGTIYSVFVDDYYIYAGGRTTQTVRKYDKDTLAYIDQTANYGAGIYSVFVDDNYIYAGGGTIRTVKKYDKDTLIYIDQTANYSGDIRSVFVDDDYIYAGGEVTRAVRKYNKDTLAYIDQTANYSGTIYSVFGSTVGENPQTSPAVLDQGDSWNVSWTVNATGSTDTQYLVDVLFNSSYGSYNVPNNDTTNSRICIGTCPAAEENTCTPPGSGDWNVLCSDNCLLSDQSITISGVLNVYGADSGTLNFDNVNLTVQDFRMNATSCKIAFKEPFKFIK